MYCFIFIFDILNEHTIIIPRKNKTSYSRWKSKTNLIENMFSKLA